MKNRDNSLLTLLLILAIAVFSIHLSQRWLLGARIDTTADDIYSLTPGSRAILQRMADEGAQPLDVRLYFSETAGNTLPKFIKDFVTYERYLRALLEQYSSASDGKIRVETIDPVPDSDAADRAVADGLDGKLINQNGDLFYFGLAFETQTGSRDAIEFLWPDQQASIEYEISKRIRGLVWPIRKRVGVLSSLDVLGGDQDPFMAQMLAAQGRAPARAWIAIGLLRELYDVEPIETDVEEISAADFDLVVVIHPKELPTKTLYALDRWITSGGNALFLLDPYAIGDTPPQNPQQPWTALQYQPASSLAPLLAPLGLEMAADRFAADLALAVRRPVGPLGGAESVLVDLRIAGEEGAQLLASELPLMQGVSDLRFFLAGSLELTGAAADGDGETIERTPLVTTTATGSTLRIEPGFGGDELAYADLNEPAKLRDRWQPGSEPVVLAYLLRGRPASAFPDGIEAADGEAEPAPESEAEEFALDETTPREDSAMEDRSVVDDGLGGEASVIVFADVDFIDDQVAFDRHPLGFVEAANDNHKLFLNAVDYLLGSQELMAVRTKRGVSRPFLLFDRIEAEAERDTLEREREIRSSIATFQLELQARQGEITQRDAALFEKRVQDEVETLNEQLAAANRELREIRKARRARIEREESKVRFAVMGWMPIFVLAIGVQRALRRRRERT